MGRGGSHGKNVVLKCSWRQQKDTQLMRGTRCWKWMELLLSLSSKSRASITCWVGLGGGKDERAEKFEQSRNSLLFSCWWAPPGQGRSSKRKWFSRSSIYFLILISNYLNTFSFSLLSPSLSSWFFGFIPTFSPLTSLRFTSSHSLSQFSSLHLTLSQN